MAESRMISKIIRDILGMNPKWKAWLVLTAVTTAVYHLLLPIPLLGCFLWMLTAMPFLELTDRLSLDLFTRNTMPLSYFLSAVYWFLVFGFVYLPILMYGRLRIITIVTGIVVLLFHIGFSWHDWSDMPF